MKKKCYCIIAALMVMVSGLTSCRKSLCYNHFATLSVAFTWEREWERDYGMDYFGNWDSGMYGIGYDDLRPALPEWVNMVNYASVNGTDERYLSVDGGDIILGDNESQTVIFYNGDTEFIVLSDMASLNDARATSTSRSRSTIAYVKERHPNTRSINPPDVLYSAYVEDMPRVALHKKKNFTVNMQPLVYTYIVRYEVEFGNEHIMLARGALGGMAESVYLRDGKTSEEAAIILYDCDVKPYGCEAHVRSFGVPGFPDQYYGKTRDNDGRPYTLNLELLLRNGKTVEFNFDVSDQLAHQPRGGVITVSGIRIEEEVSQVESGFDVDVSDWEEKEIIQLPIDFDKDDEE